MAAGENLDILLETTATNQFRGMNQIAVVKFLQTNNT